MAPQYLTRTIQYGRDIHQHFTRQAGDLRLLNFKKSCTQNSLFYKGFNLYNMLPESARETTNLREFKELCKLFEEAFHRGRLWGRARYDGRLLYIGHVLMRMSLGRIWNKQKKRESGRGPPCGLTLCAHMCVEQEMVPKPKKKPAIGEHHKRLYNDHVWAPWDDK